MKMAPSPEIDNIPKAPDKSDKNKSDNLTLDKTATSTNSENVPKDTSVTNLDDGQLKALLDEAITYKSPRDRAGKSDLFNSLLKTAEDDLRTARATSASGPELARYFNTTATRRNRNKRKPSSISENLTHGGSLNDLAKEELYESACHLQRPKKTVSARQREGGSLPCNVNAGAYDKQFFLEEQAKAKCSKIKEKKEYTTIDMESESLIDNDSLGMQYDACEAMEVDEIETVVSRSPRVSGGASYTSNATLQIGADEPIYFPLEGRVVNNLQEQIATADATYKHIQNLGSNYGLLSMPATPWFRAAGITEEKKVDENGNALGQGNTDTKKRKKANKKIEKDVIKAEDVAGHRSDIIGDIDKLVEFISGDEKPKAPVKKLHKHMSDDKAKHKQRTRSSKGSKSANIRGSMQKSNSMEEISTTKLEDFNLDAPRVEVAASKLVLRSTKSNASERPRERRSWGNTEQLQFYQNAASVEHLENADFTFVTKKKKSKKRRNSLGNRRQLNSRDTQSSEFNRVPSPQLRRKSACSVPHSEKSNDSSDADSVHSLPIDVDKDGLNLPISYADMAKHSNMERPKWNRPQSERKKSQTSEKVAAKNEIIEPSIIKTEPVPDVVEPKQIKKSENKQKSTKETKEIITSPPIKLPATTPVKPVKIIPDKNVNKIETIEKTAVNNLVNQKNNFAANNWPEIRNNKANNYKNLGSIVDWPSIQNNNKIDGKVKQCTPPPPLKIDKSPPVVGTAAVNIKNIKNNSVLPSPPVAAVVVVKKQEVVVVPKNMPVNHATDNQNCATPVANPIPPTATVTIPVAAVLNNTQQVIQTVPEQQQSPIYPYQIPANIPDVQTIEKMHFKHLQNSPYTTTTAIINNGAVDQVHINTHLSPPPCNMTEPVTPEVEKRPAVVILSGEDKHTSDIDITFGFDINEQLLSGDVCADFIGRFFVPDMPHSVHTEKLVNYIGNEWDDVINQINSGKVKYYSEDL